MEKDKAAIEHINELLRNGFPDQALDILLPAYGPDHPFVGIGYNALADKQYQSKNWEGAKETLKKSLKIWERYKGGSSLEVAGCMNNLARVYENLGRNQKGLDLHEQALEIRRKRLGDTHPDTGMSIMGYASALFEKGDIKKAKQLFNEGLILFEKIDMNDSPEADACRKNIRLCEAMENSSGT